MITDYLKLGSNEVINTARLKAYLASVGSPLANGSDICSCDSLTAEVLGDEPYTTPSDPASPAPWYDVDVPDSAAFLGFLPLSFDGVDDYPVTRSINASVSGIGSIGPQRVAPREITVTGILLGATCCGVEYGLHWLAETLQGCNGGACAGDCVSMYQCCPPAALTPEQYNARYRRTFRRVALTSGPTVTARNGTGSCGSGTCGTGADIITVEFTLTAGSPWAWTDAIPMLDVDLPGDDSEDCIDWCLDGPSSPDPACTGFACKYAECVAATAVCQDPNCLAADLPDINAAELCNCLPLATERACYSLDLTTRPQWSSDALNVVIRAGATELRNVSVILYGKNQADIDAGTPCDVIADNNRCNPVSSWYISYVPAGGVVTLDGQIERATLDCGGTCGPARDVFGASADPATFTALTCAQYCLCVETDVNNPPGIGSGMSVTIAGKGL